MAALAVVLPALVLLPAAGADCFGPVCPPVDACPGTRCADVRASGDASAAFLPVSVLGSATCEDINSLCIAVSGTGHADGRVAAVSGQSASAPGAAASRGDASGRWLGISVSGASTGVVGVSGLGTAAGLLAVGGGGATGPIAVAAAGPAASSGPHMPYPVSSLPGGDACRTYCGLAVSATGAAGGPVALSGGGPASAKVVSVSGLGSSSASYLAASGTGSALSAVAVSGTGPSSGFVAVAPIGHASGTVPLSANRCNDSACFGASPTEPVRGTHWLAASGTGPAEAGRSGIPLGAGSVPVGGYGISGTGDSAGLVAATGTGTSRGLVAVAATGDAHGEVAGVSGTGNATGIWAFTGPELAAMAEGLGRQVLCYYAVCAPE